MLETTPTHTHHGIYPEGYRRYSSRTRSLWTFLRVEKSMRRVTVVYRLNHRLECHKYVEFNSVEGAELIQSKL